MTINLGPELEAALNEHARRQGVPAETLVVSILREKFPVTVPPFEPRDEWERQLLALGRDCGVSLSNEAVSREGLYD